MRPLLKIYSMPVSISLLLMAGKAILAVVAVLIGQSGRPVIFILSSLTISFFLRITNIRPQANRLLICKITIENGFHLIPYILVQSLIYEISLILIGQISCFINVNNHMNLLVFLRYLLNAIEMSQWETSQVYSVIIFTYRLNNQSNYDLFQLLINIYHFTFTLYPLPLA